MSVAWHTGVQLLVFFCSSVPDCLDLITPMFRRGANLSVSEVTKVAVRNGMNGEFTRINCQKLRREFTKERNAKTRVDQ